jgi:hypothetical protein
LDVKLIRPAAALSRVSDSAETPREHAFILLFEIQNPKNIAQANGPP